MTETPSIYATELPSFNWLIGRLLAYFGKNFMKLGQKREKSF